MDGKQARNTKNSSPLGLLFDHGIDSINNFLLICTIPSLFQMGPTYYFLLFACSLFMGFYYATLEQYYIGGLFLPIFNGVSDGSVLIIVVETISGFTGIIL
jgi:ethanolaminephosphotransferase